MRIIKMTIRRLRHKVENEQKIAERYIVNTVYTTEYKNQMLLYPIPDFIEDKRCMCPSCNKEGICISDKFFVFCGSCASNQFDNPTLTQDKVLIVPSVDQAVRGNAFEWQIQGKDDWYKVKGSNITWDSTQRLSAVEVKKRWDEIMYQVLSDVPQVVEAEYIKDEPKKLVIYV